MTPITKKIIIALAAAFPFLIRATLADTVAYLQGESAPPLSISPMSPTSTDVISFSTPLDGRVHSNECEMRVALSGSPVLTRDAANQQITLSTDGVFSQFCTRIFRPHSGAQGEFGPLAAGSWSFDDGFGNEISFTVTGAFACDLDGDGDCDHADIDILYLDDGDIDAWLMQASDSANPAKLTSDDEYAIGDTNLDGGVDSADLGLLLNSFGLSGGAAATWMGGDLDDNGQVDSTDLASLLNNFGFASASTKAIPEPSAILLLCVGFLPFMRIRARLGAELDR